MLPFGGTPICPTCEKAVYAAEQVIGPGRKLYHKPCLSCQSCKKRLDSYTLLEHDLKPYCKICHSKLFSTSAVSGHRTASPVREPKRQYTFNGGFGPVGDGSGPNSRSGTPAPDDEARDSLGDLISSEDVEEGANLARSNSAVTSAMFDKANRPLMQTSTGTRYGTALEQNITGSSTSSNGSSKKWGGTNPTCPKCNKAVYFAEQVKAVGKTWHKGCLRCSECNTLLDSTRLRDRDGIPLCKSCYSKLYGPSGWKLGGG